jgi:subtilase family serine protease
MWEWAHALAPDANILLVEARSDGSEDLYNAIQYANTQNPQVVSMSWGGPEYDRESSDDATYFSHSGIVYLAASGDQGDSAGVDYPAASPNVIAVGGTSLPLDANGNLTGPETAWDDSYGSTGGGISSYETEPGYQTSFGVPYSGGRCVPDVAFDADPGTGVSVYFDGSKFGSSPGWWVIGGTSLSVQCWAGIIALDDQNSPLTNASQALYQLAGSNSNYNSYGAFRDITSGGNGTYNAGVGYDLCTGLGSPLANILVPGPSVVPVVSSISTNLGPIDGGTTVTITGTGFTSNATVSFGVYKAAVTNISSNGTTITVTSPAVTDEGPVDITVSTAGGTSVKSSADQFTYFMYGDVNGDGTVNSADALLVLQYSVGLINLTADQAVAANVNGGTVNSADALLILQYSVGLISEFPVQQ